MQWVRTLRQRSWCEDISTIFVVVITVSPLLVFSSLAFNHLHIKPPTSLFKFRDTFVRKFALLWMHCWPSLWFWAEVTQCYPFLCLLVLRQFLCILLHCGLMPPVTSRSKHQKSFCYATPQSDACSIHMHGLFIDSYSIKSITCKSPSGFYTFVTSITECNTIGSYSGITLLCLISRQPLFDESSRFANFLFV